MCLLTVDTKNYCSLPYILFVAVQNGSITLAIVEKVNQGSYFPKASDKRRLRTGIALGTRLYKTLRPCGSLRGCSYEPG